MKGTRDAAILILVVLAALSVRLPADLGAAFGIGDARAASAASDDRVAIERLPALAPDPVEHDHGATCPQLDLPLSSSAPRPIRPALRAAPDPRPDASTVTVVPVVGPEAGERCT